MRVEGAWRSSEFISSTGILRPVDSRCTDYKGQVGLRGMGGAQQHGRGTFLSTAASERKGGI